MAGATHGVDSNLVYVTSAGVLVRSKSEVILADILESVVPGRWVYEQELVGTDGTIRYPDFTIETTTGRRIIWEHLGMLDDPRFAANWDAKKQWYRANGVLPMQDVGGPEGTLVWTDDRAVSMCPPGDSSRSRGSAHRRREALLRRRRRRKRRFPDGREG